jgi:hypothetical protein
MYQPGEIDRIVPSIEGNIGSPSKVDIGEIASVLSQAGTALDMVRSSSFGGNLTNIAYIYNSSESGAFGVFDPNIDRSVKVKIVEAELKKMGYSVRYENGSLYAWSDDKNPDQVRDEMDKMYGNLDLKGGLVIGINAAKILDIAKKNFQDLSKQISGSEYKPLDQSDFDLLVALHLGSTIVHESVHALGAKDESAPIQAQKKWTNEKIGELNSTRKSQGRIPFEMGSEIYNASSKMPIKKAQIVPFLDAVLPEAMLQSFSDFDNMFFPVDKKPNDSMETILQKNHHKPLPPDFSVADGLSADYTDDEVKRMTLQELLENARPRPIIRPVRKTAGINSNLGGPNIGGPFYAIDEAIPRVMDGRDIVDRIDYKEGEDPYWHKRYRPENVSYQTDRFGRMSYQYDVNFTMIDYCNNNPMTWSSLYREDIVTGPWRKAAAIEADDKTKNIILESMRKIGFYKFQVKSGKRPAVRMYCFSYMSDAIERACSDMRVYKFEHGDHDAIWLVSPHVDEKAIINMEKAIIIGDSDSVDEIMGTSARISDQISYILTVAKTVCREHGINSVYAVGGLPRTMIGSGDYREVNDIDFTSGNPTECLKMGGLLAEELNATDMSVLLRTMTMSFSYDGMKMDFRGNFVPVDVRDLMRKNGVQVTSLNYDIYARDFTANSLLYDFVKGKIYDITGMGIEDAKSKVVKTIFQPGEIIPRNPLIITRAIIMALRGYTIVPELMEAMLEHSGSVFTGNITQLRLAYEYVKISRYDNGESMLEEYNLSGLKDIWRKAKDENPELFEE